MVSEVLESAGVPLSKSCEINDENFDTLHPDGEKFHILLHTQPYYNPEDWLFLLDSLNLKICVDFSLLFQRKQPCSENPANYLLIIVCTF